jgi:hypothetical protein
MKQSERHEEYKNIQRMVRHAEVELLTYFALHPNEDGSVVKAKLKEANTILERLVASTAGGRDDN